MLPENGEQGLARRNQRPAVGIEQVPVQHVELVVRHGVDDVLELGHGHVGARRVDGQATVREHRSVHDSGVAHHHQRLQLFVPRHQLRQRLQAVPGAEEGGGRYVRRRRRRRRVGGHHQLVGLVRVQIHRRLIGRDGHFDVDAVLGRPVASTAGRRLHWAGILRQHVLDECREDFARFRKQVARLQYHVSAVSTQFDHPIIKKKPKQLKTTS